jgi:hypothetical protein
MRIKRLFQFASGLLAALGLCALLYSPTQVSAMATHLGFAARTRSASTSVNTNVYLTSSMLQSTFQSSLDQQLPQIVSDTISTIVGQLPQQDQSWAAAMANVLLQPSATLVSLAPQSSGLLATLRLSLYPGDPKPQTLSLLLGFSVVNATTLQVTSLPINGKPGFVNGPLTTFSVPIGSLNSAVATPNCGDSEIKISLKFPVSLSQSGQTSQVQPAATGAQTVAWTSSLPASTQATSAISTYIEMPASSLAQLGSSVGTMQVSSSITAKNIQIGVQGSDLTLTSDIYLLGLHIGTAVSTVAPGAANGDLVVKVLSTKLQMLGGLISFPLNSYNTQIEQIMNKEFSGALTGKFTVAQAAIGANPHLSCAASTSLVLGGMLNLK